MTGYANDSVPREKLDNMGMEYAYLLTSQLESQRAYFEEQLAKATDKSAKAAAAAEEASPMFQVSSGFSGESTNASGVGVASLVDEGCSTVARFRRCTARSTWRRGKE